MTGNSHFTPNRGFDEDLLKAQKILLRSKKEKNKKHVKNKTVITVVG
jgi:hypothetical protein